MKNKLLVGILLLLVIVLFVYFSYFSNESEALVEDEIVELEKEEISNSNVAKNTKVKVDIKGAINKPGVYEVESGKRVIDVIKQAGNLKKNANTNYINLSAKVEDEMVIWIYTNSEIEKLKLEQSSVKYMISECNCPVVDNTTCLNSENEDKDKNMSNSTNTIVNINTATLEELMTLDGVGESKAKSIIEYREKNGKFNSIEEIMNVSGIGESAFNKIKEFISI